MKKDRYREGKHKERRYAPQMPGDTKFVANDFQDPKTINDKYKSLLAGWRLEQKMGSERYWKKYARPDEYAKAWK